jgi:hypothetical protein
MSGLVSRRKRLAEVRIPDDPAKLPDYLDQRAERPVANDGDGWEQLTLDRPD